MFMEEKSPLLGVRTRLRRPVEGSRMDSVAGRNTTWEAREADRTSSISGTASDQAAGACMKNSDNEPDLAEVDTAEPNGTTTDPEPPPGRWPARRVRSVAVRVVVIASLVWTVVAWRSIPNPAEKLATLPFFAAALAIGEICFVGGAVRVATSVGAWVKSNDDRWWVQLRRVRKDFRSLVGASTATRRFRVGFVLNWCGAVISGLLGLVAVVVFLPPTGWGLVLVPVLDLVATFAWRSAVVVRLREAPALDAGRP